MTVQPWRELLNPPKDVSLRDAICELVSTAPTAPDDLIVSRVAQAVGAHEMAFQQHFNYAVAAGKVQEDERAAWVRLHHNHPQLARQALAASTGARA